jgi:hypothetical protein
VRRHAGLLLVDNFLIINEIWKILGAFGAEDYYGTTVSPILPFESPSSWRAGRKIARGMADSATKELARRLTFAENTKTYEKDSFACFGFGGDYPAHRYGLGRPGLLPLRRHGKDCRQLLLLRWTWLEGLFSLQWT